MSVTPRPRRRTGHERWATALVVRAVATTRTDSPWHDLVCVSLVGGGGVQVPVTGGPGSTRRKKQRNTIEDKLIDWEERRKLELRNKAMAEAQKECVNSTPCTLPPTHDCSSACFLESVGCCDPRLVRALVWAGHGVVRHREATTSGKYMSPGSQRILKRLEKRGQAPASVTEPRRAAATAAVPPSPPVHERLHRPAVRPSPKQRAATAAGKPVPETPPRSHNGASVTTPSSGGARRKPAGPPPPPPAKVVAAIHK